MRIHLLVKEKTIKILTIFTKDSHENVFTIRIIVKQQSYFKIHLYTQKS